MKYPEDLKYTKNDEWVRLEGGIATIGISDFAQDQLSDIVYIEISLEIGASAAKGDNFGTVESVKAASDVYLPVGGKILEINEMLLETPETLNADPYGEGWLLKLELSDANQMNDLFDYKSYQANTKERE